MVKFWVQKWKFDLKKNIFSPTDGIDNNWNEKYAVRENLRGAKKEFNKTEDDLKSLQSVGQIIGEVLRPLDNERCITLFLYFSLSFSAETNHGR